MKREKECLKLKVVLFPWLAHGHITPFLELAKGLSERNFICYICSTPINLAPIRIPPNYSSRIHLLHLHLPPSPQLPPEYHTTNGLPPHLNAALNTAVKAARPAFSDLVAAVQPDLLIHDVLYPWAPAAVSALGIPAVTFYTSSAASLSYFMHSMMHRGVDFPFAATRLHGFQLSAMAAVADAVAEEGKEKEGEDDGGGAVEGGGGVALMNSSREMEGKYLDYLTEMTGRKIVPIGAFVQDSCTGDNVDGEIMEWLGQKDKISCVFVSFGSEYFLKKEEIEAIAHGLEMSNVSFIWVIRFPKGEEMKVEEALPEGFVERVGERGKIVEKWAPQAKILGHGSVGGFVSHCGWNSLKESICYGVPIIAVPMHLDQPVNAKLASELGVGVEVERDDEGRLQEEEISSVIRDVVVGERGQALRTRVGEKRERIRLTSKQEMDDVAHLLGQLCGKTNAPNNRMLIPTPRGHEQKNRNPNIQIEI